MLSEIAHELRRYLVANPMAAVVRERALDKQGGPQKSRTIEVLHKVVGVADLYAYGFGGRQFEEVPPQTVKKALTNNANAEKDEVAAALEQFVGKREYACDDESDAVAVGISWLIQQHKLDDPYADQKKKPKRKGVSDDDG